MSKVVIADTGPIIAFARLDLLALLPKIFECVYVTDEVVSECLAGRDGDEIARIHAALENGFERIAAPDYAHLLFNIDAGEASAIAVAVECGCGVLIDDKLGRKMAGNLGVPVIGTLGALIISRRRKLVPAIKPLIDDLLTSGYYLGADVIATALAACDEQIRLLPARKANRLMEKELTHDAPGFINLTTLCEIVWVLKRNYRLDEPGQVAVVDGLLTSKQLLVENVAVAWKALRAYETGNADFSDAVIAYANAAHECEYTVTFDKQASKLAEMRLI